MKNTIKEEIVRILGVDKNLVTVTNSKNLSYGDFSVPCFPFAKQLHKNPTTIAEELSQQINSDIIDHTECINGYFNIFIKKNNYYTKLQSAITDDTYGSMHIDGSALIEHTSINPNASPHIGRARNAFIGNALTNLLKFCGYKTEVHYFLNNIGKQIAMLAIMSKGQENLKFEDFLNLYISAQARAEKDEAFVKDSFALLKAVESGDSDAKALFDKVVNVCMEGQLQIFKDLGITYDKFDIESDFVLSGKTKNVLQNLQGTGKCFLDEENRWVLNLSEEVPEAPYLPLTRGDGSSLYALRDIAYTKWKSEQICDKNIVVLGQDQKTYYKQIKTALSLIGCTNIPELVCYQFVTLIDGKMSTRAGKVVLLEDLKKEALSKTMESSTNCHTPEQIKKIAYATVLYSILKSSPEKEVTFDWESALSMDGNSALYIMYNYARIQSIKKKTQLPAISNVNWDYLSSDEEMELIKLIEQYPEVIKKAHDDLNVFGIAQYVYALSKTFSKYYSHCKILDINNLDSTVAKTYLITAVGNLIKSGMKILGIDVVDKI